MYYYSYQGSPFYNSQAIKTIIVEDGVTSIGERAFESCNAICYTTIGSDAAKALGKVGYSFRDGRYPKLSLRYYCNNDGKISGFGVEDVDNDIETGTIKSMLRIPSGVQTIEEYAFAEGGFEAVVIPDGCRSIGSGAFADCPNLCYVWIPESVTNIAEDAFAGSPNVKVERPE